MKKLSILFLSVAFTGGVAMACPHEDGAKASENAPKTAEKTKSDDKAKPAEKTKEADKTKTAKPAEKKPAEKKPEKTAQK